ncbi:MAG: gamma-glutamylcyclotransferase [Cyanobacteria bacterium J06623_7]
MKSQSSTDVFVYGTLKPGEANFAAYCQGRVKQQVTAYAWGSLYALPVGYPAMTTGKDKVWGVVLSFTEPQILASLDRLEGYQANRPAHLNEYDRAWVSVYDKSDRQIGQAWAYQMSLGKVRQYQGVRLNSGSWTDPSRSN